MAPHTRHRGQPDAGPGSSSSSSKTPAFEVENRPPDAESGPRTPRPRPRLRPAAERTWPAAPATSGFRFCCRRLKSIPAYRHLPVVGAHRPGRSGERPARPGGPGADAFLSKETRAGRHRPLRPASAVSRRGLRPAGAGRNASATRVTFLDSPFELAASREPPPGRAAVRLRGRGPSQSSLQGRRSAQRPQGRGRAAFSPARAAESANQAQERLFWPNMSHEIRTPMNANHRP